MENADIFGFTEKAFRRTNLKEGQKNQQKLEIV